VRRKGDEIAVKLDGLGLRSEHVVGEKEKMAETCPSLPNHLGKMLLIVSWVDLVVSASDADDRIVKAMDEL
jgi:hypothetical protein